MEATFVEQAPRSFEVGNDYMLSSVSQCSSFAGLAPQKRSGASYAPKRLVEPLQRTRCKLPLFHSLFLSVIVVICSSLQKCPISLLETDDIRVSIQFDYTLKVGVQLRNHTSFSHS